jgi:hypothetical protein
MRELERLAATGNLEAQAQLAAMRLRMPDPGSPEQVAQAERHGSVQLAEREVERTFNELEATPRGDLSIVPHAGYVLARRQLAAARGLDLIPAMQYAAVMRGTHTSDAILDAYQRLRGRPWVTGGRARKLTSSEATAILRAYYEVQGYIRDPLSTRDPSHATVLINLDHTRRIIFSARTMRTETGSRGRWHRHPREHEQIVSLIAEAERLLAMAARRVDWRANPGRGDEHLQELRRIAESSYSQDQQGRWLTRDPEAVAAYLRELERAGAPTRLLTLHELMSASPQSPYHNYRSFLSDVRYWGNVGYSELAMHVRLAGRPVIRWSVRGPEPGPEGTKRPPGIRPRAGRVGWARIEVLKGKPFETEIVDGLPGEVLPDQVRRDLGGFGDERVP